MSTASVIINISDLQDMTSDTSNVTAYYFPELILPMATIPNNDTNMTVTLTTEELLLQKLGEKSQDLLSAVFLLTIYGLVFISGTVGNVCTCIVIVRNNYMRTTTNFYLFSLAVSDVIILLLGK